VKSLLKKLYYRILNPLRLLVQARCEAMVAEERSAREELVEQLQRIQIDNQNIRERLDEQLEYVAELRLKGLHEMLSHYQSNKLRLPETVLAAVADVVRGMEPSIASTKHKVPAHEIIYWSSLLFEKLNANGSNKIDQTSAISTAASQSTSYVSDVEQHAIQLLENQLQFNMKTSLHREEAINLEITRLEEELRLEKYSGMRAVSGK
jgi:hypothetical protein